VSGEAVTFSRKPDTLRMYSKVNMVVWLQERIYRRTASGEQAFASDDLAIPSDYRLILRVIEGNTHSDVIRGRLRQFSDALLAD
jgi:hypothetical protein